MQPMARSNATNIRSWPKYPRVKVQIAGAYGGFHPTAAAVQAAMRQAGIPLQELSNFCAEAADAQDDNLLRTCLRWVDVDVR